VSRIGKMPVSLPQGVTVAIDPSNLVVVRGPKGELKQQFPGEITLEQVDTSIQVSRPTDQKTHRALHGLSRSLLNNMVLATGR
jgi:large subunit ribosomal protein L6